MVALSRSAIVASFACSLVLLACGGEAAKKPVAPTPQARETEAREGTRQTTSLVSEGAPVPGAAAEAPDAETPEQIYARLRGDLVACYERGLKAIPTMTSGRATINVAIDRAGKATCIVVSDDTGLTQEVEDCMSARVARESFKSNGGTWTTELPVLVKDKKLALGPPATAAPAIESVETHGLPDSAHEVVEALLPQLHACTEGTAAKEELHVMHVGARVAKDGRVECAIASSPAPLPAKMRDCAADVLAGAKFPQPRSSVGLVSVPVKILAKKKK